MIRISDAAQAHFAKLLANQEEGTQIRVFVINPGTPNAECGVSYCPPDAVEATDTALKFDLLTAYVDELSAPYRRCRDRLCYRPVGFSVNAESPERQNA